MIPAGGLGFAITPAAVIAAVLTLIPLAASAFFSPALTAWVQRMPLALRLVCPAALCVPYVLVAASAGVFEWSWFAVYAALPVGLAVLLWQAGEVDRAQRGNWREFLVLAALGLAVDLRWFERAWPPHLATFNKIIL